MIHRDITPANILIGLNGIVKLTDFGLARAHDRSSMTQPGILKGKLSYMSPEQISGQRVDHRSDLFSLGVVLYEVATGLRGGGVSSGIMVPWGRPNSDWMISSDCWATAKFAK